MGGGHAVVFAESAREVELVAESQGIADFFDRAVRNPQQVYGGEHDLFIYILSQGNLHFLSEFFL